MENGKHLVEEYVPVKSRVWVSAGDAAMALLQALIGGGALTYYYTRVLGLSPGLASTAWLVFGIWNAINDPLLGYIADRTRSKIGRRIPYIRYGSPLVVITFVILWAYVPAFQTSQGALFAQMIIGLFLFDTLYTAIATSLYLMPYEMAVSNKARSSIFIWKIIFQAFSIGVPLVVIPIIQPGPGEDATAFRWIVVIAAVVLCAVIFFSTWFYEEKHFQQAEKQPSFLAALTESFKNKPFLIFLVSSFTVIYCQTGLMQGVLYYFDEIKVPGLPVYLGLGVGVIAGVLLWVNLRERIGVKNCLLAWLAAFALGCFVMAAFGRSLPAAVISMLLIGVGFSGGMYLIPLMNGDVIDFDETRTGLRREGIYAGINSLVTKPAISIAQAIFLAILTRFGYDQALAKGLQSTSAQTGIMLAWTLVPGIMLVISFLATLLYPLAGKKWVETKDQLAQTHAEKEKAYLESLGYKAD